MAHYFAVQDTLRFPFHSVREIKMVISGGRERRQASRFPKLLYVLDGTCRVRMADGFAAVLNAGDLFLVPKPCHHYYSAAPEAPDAELHAFAIFTEPGALIGRRRPPCDTEAHRLLCEIMPHTRHLPGLLTPGMQSLIHQFREENHSARPGTLNRQDALARELLVETARRLADPGLLPQRPAVRARSQAYIANEVREYLGKTIHRRHTLAEIAWRFHLSGEHLARLFKKEMGLGVMQFLRDIRVDTGRNMLLSTNHPIAVLASMLGFSSSNHFCRAFTQLTGMTPTVYRRQYAGVIDPAAASPPGRKKTSPQPPFRH